MSFPHVRERTHVRSSCSGTDGLSDAVVAWSRAALGVLRILIQWWDTNWYSDVQIPIGRCSNPWVRVGARGEDRNSWAVLGGAFPVVTSGHIGQVPKRIGIRVVQNILGMS